ncbi:hypothetical protein [Muricoccus radiodurans]|uniref:hypothetical protein n=1 Tax=Muricoccus radiodurans TaxID=2231721 RepID=UPI003CF2B760
MLSWRRDAEGGAPVVARARVLRWTVGGRSLPVWRREAEGGVVGSAVVTGVVGGGARA